MRVCVCVRDKCKFVKLLWFCHRRCISSYIYIYIHIWSIGKLSFSKPKSRKFCICLPIRSYGLKIWRKNSLPLYCTSIICMRTVVRDDTIYKARVFNLFRPTGGLMMSDDKIFVFFVLVFKGSLNIFLAYLFNALKI